MTRRVNIRAATGAALLLALLAGTALAATTTTTAATTKNKAAIVIATDDARAIADAKATGQTVRIVHTTAEQLGVTHLLAAQHYNVVTTIGVDRRIAIAPVEEKFPQTRFVAAEAN